MQETATAFPNSPGRSGSAIRAYVQREQQYSPENLLDVILHEPPPTVWKIVPAYSDHGRSGLNIVGRKGLSRLRVHDHDAHLNRMLVHSEWDHYCLGQ